MRLQKFVNSNYKIHLLIGYVVRLALVCYGIFHDKIYDVPYTDIDYRVFTDASRHILNGNSPYERHTYRYSPLIAILLIPNVIFHHSFGKLLFCIVDIFVAILVRLIVKNNLKEYENYKQKATKQQSEVKLKQLPYKKQNNHNKSKYRHGNNKNIRKEEKITTEEIDLTNLCMLFWLYNPMTLAIGTRGNCDSLATFFVLLTLYFLQCKRKYFISGILHGFSIHFRLYPVIYSLSLFMFLSKFSFYSTEDRRTIKNTIGSNVKAIKSGSNVSNNKRIKNAENTIIVQKNINSNVCLQNKNIDHSQHNIKNKRTIFKKELLLYLLPNIDQVKLVSGTILSLSLLIGTFYYLYGYKFVFETYIYHFVRTDTRHNFSLYFYLQYLTAWVKTSAIMWQKILMTLPKVVLLLVFSVRYGLNKISLNFGILTETITMVMYNPVLTSQYWVWIIAVLPLSMWQIRMPRKEVFFLVFLWFIAQISWLLPAYLLEFQGKNTFLLVWVQGVSFFCANIVVLGKMIKYYMPVTEKFD